MELQAANRKREQRRRKASGEGAQDDGEGGR